MAQFDSLLEEVRAAREMPPPDKARAIRVAAGLTQARVAAELGISRTTLSRWETGTMRPTSEQRVRYAQLLTALQREVAA